MRRRMAVAILASVACLLAACSSSSSPSTTTPTSHVVQSASSTSPPTTAPTGPPLSSLLLTVNDLPAGWVVDNSTSSSTASGCLSSSTNTPTSVNATFAQGGSLPELLEVLDRKGDAEQRFGAVVSALNACHSTTITGSGQSITLSIGAMSFPSEGDQSNAYDFSGSVEGLAVNLGLVIIRKGYYLLGVGLVDIGSVDTDSLESFVSTAMEKLPS